MKGYGTCKEAPDHNAEGTSHCIHRRPVDDDYICCWCGDLFVGEDDEHPNEEHGQYHSARKHVYAHSPTQGNCLLCSQKESHPLHEVGP